MGQRRIEWRTLSRHWHSLATSGAWRATSSEFCSHPQPWSSSTEAFFSEERSPSSGAENVLPVGLAQSSTNDLHLVRIRIPTFAVVYFSRGTLPQKRAKGHQDLATERKRRNHTDTHANAKTETKGHERTRTRRATQNPGIALNWPTLR